MYETCRDRIIPLFPIISVSESLLADKASDEHVAKYASVDRNPPTPLPHIVRMIHCAIAAASRNVPADVRSSVFTSLHRLLTGPEMTKISTTRCLGTVQVLLLLSMCDDLNGSSAVGASETVWQNVGSAIRMGFGIVGLTARLAVDVLGIASECVARSDPILPAESPSARLGSLHRNGQMVSRVQV